MRGASKDVSGKIVFTPDPIQPELKIGIYWYVDDVIVGDAVTANYAEPYGDALQHGGHYEFWEQLKPGIDAERKLKSHAYDYYPRGRLVYFPKRKSVRIYVDSCLDNDAINAALDFFGHNKYQVEIESDEHYQCVGCNRHYLGDY